MEYSEPIYYDYKNKRLINGDYSPFKPTSTQTSLHGVRIGGFDPPRYDQELTEDKVSSNKFIKYKGLQLKDDLSVNTFQRFKAEWNAYLLVNSLTPKQKKEQMIDKAIAGNAKLIASQHFQESFAQASHEDILAFLEN